MCTVSWLEQDGGFQLLCNRDEQRTRAGATPPEAVWIDGVRVLMPTDGQSGGTWIAVNEYGVAVTLLNRPGTGGGALSRGLVLRRLASARTATEVCEKVERMDLGAVAPFTVAALETGRPAAIAAWNGAVKETALGGDVLPPLASSSYDDRGAQAARQREFERVCGAAPAAGRLLVFHRSHTGLADGCKDAYSVCMHRADAETVSFSWISVTRRGAAFRYQPGAPCFRRPAVAISLALRTP